MWAAQYFATHCAAQGCPTPGCFQVLETVLAMLMPDFITDPNILQVSKVYQGTAVHVYSTKYFSHPIVRILSVKLSDFQLYEHIRINWGAFKTNIEPHLRPLNQNS